MARAFKQKGVSFSTCTRSCTYCNTKLVSDSIQRGFGPLGGWFESHGEMNYRLETGEKGLSEVAGSAESAAEAAEICRFDDNLDEVIEAWAGLSEPDREAVLRIVQESAERGKG